MTHTFRKTRLFLSSLYGWSVLLLAAFTLFYGTLPHPWFFRRLEMIPTAYFLFWGLLALPAVFFCSYADGWWKCLLRVTRAVSHIQRRHPIAYFFSVFTIVPFLFWYFRIQRVDSGDIVHFIHFARQGIAFLVEHAPLESFIRCLLVDTAVRIHPYVDLVFLLKVWMCMYGALFIYVVTILCGKLPRPYSILGPVFLLISPTLVLFCGYMEIYGPTIIAQTLFLLLSLLYLHRKVSIEWISITFGVAIGTAMWHGIFVFGYLYLLWHALQRHEITLKAIPSQLILVFTPFIVSIALLIPYANPFAGFITRVGQPGLLIPFNQEAVLRGYTLFSAEHIADFCSTLILFAFAGVILVITRFLCTPRHVIACFHRPTFVFLVWSSAGALALGFFYYPFIGMPLDWDLYSFMFPSLSLLGVEIMHDGLFSRFWRKQVAVLVFIVMAITSAWVLQSSLFTRYPLIASKVGPVMSWVVPNFYYGMMDKAANGKQERHLYWLADQALAESPGKYKEIMHYMDEWCISTIAKQVPEEHDSTGWAVDIASQPGFPETVYIFDRYGRIFHYVDHVITWVFAPEDLVSSPIVAGDIDREGAAILLSKNGKVYRIGKEFLEQGMQANPAWATLNEVFSFLPASPSKLNFPVHTVDFAIQPTTNHICVLDNYNRVWDIETQEKILDGKPSKDLSMAMHFNSLNLPITIDINNQLSYDDSQFRLPFKNPWFFPIVRDFWMTPDEKGMVILDLNGNLHYSGLTPIFETAVIPGKIIDRFQKMAYMPSRDRLLLLDNRFRVVPVELDPTGSVAHTKLRGMIDGGNFTDAYNTMRVIWQKGSQFTTICYNLIDTEQIRNIRSSIMYQEFDRIDMFVDVLPIREDTILLLDRWGRLAYETKGNYSLLEGSGITRWPRQEACDGAVYENGTFFLCKDGTVWHYAFPLFFGQPQKPNLNIPTLWCDLADYLHNENWVSIEVSKDNTTLLALTSNGKTVAIDIETKQKQRTLLFPPEANNLFDLAITQTPQGMALACTSRSGPIYLYTDWNQSAETIQNSFFGGPVIGDITFSSDLNLVVTDQFGALHQFSPSVTFSDKPYSVIKDVIALRFLPNTDKAIWVRSNGEFTWLRVQR
jgi:hypothetical protein